MLRGSIYGQGTRYRCQIRQRALRATWHRPILHSALKPGPKCRVSPDGHNAQYMSRGCELPNFPRRHGIEIAPAQSLVCNPPRGGRRRVHTWLSIIRDLFQRILRDEMSPTGRIFTRQSCFSLEGYATASRFGRVWISGPTLLRITRVSA